MVEVVAALIWNEDKFMICQRPHSMQKLLMDYRKNSSITI